MTATTYRIHPQPSFNFGGLVIDNFAGGGGASTGIEMALGRPVDIAINHDPEAIAMHEINHPHTKHYCESVWEVDPREITGGRPVDAITERPYRWTIYLAGLHRPDNADPYMKSEELSLGGIYLAESLVDVIEPRAKALQAVCNPDHFIGMAWIAMPYEASLTEAQAERVFDAFGAWSHAAAA